MTQADIQLVVVFIIIAAAITYLVLKLSRKHSGDCGNSPDSLTDDNCDNCPLKKNCKKISQKFATSKNMPTFATQNQKRRLRK